MQVGKCKAYNDDGPNGHTGRRTQVIASNQPPASPIDAVDLIRGTSDSTAGLSVRSDEIPGVQFVNGAGRHRRNLCRRSSDNSVSWDNVARITSEDDSVPVNAYLVKENIPDEDRLRLLEEALLNEFKFRQQIVQAEVVGVARDSFTCSTSRLSSSSFTTCASNNNSDKGRRNLVSTTNAVEDLKLDKLRLYGRDKEVRLLGEAYGNFLYGGNTRRKCLILIGGSSGCGKSLTRPQRQRRRHLGKPRAGNPVAYVGAVVAQGCCVWQAGGACGRGRAVSFASL